MNSKNTGNAAEMIAVKHLSSKGYCVLHTNYRNCFGEIDIIARQGPTLVFVEVKSKTGTSFGFPLEAITKHKSSKLIQVAEGYLKEYPDSPEDWRIDAVGVLFNKQNGKTLIEHVPGAIERSDGF
ncbi:MAG: YraN family protein [Dehalococcoidales bacterium]|jgi:putative endonuclease|nr:YraN family protein [Dehalococcoidales bacterium]MDD4230469.1 YraN family protein [Dehalococcoidales bacterium]